jgi:hypothetical protein
MIVVITDESARPRIQSPGNWKLRDEFAEYEADQHLPRPDEEV